MPAMPDSGGGSSGGFSTANFRWRKDNADSECIDPAIASGSSERDRRLGKVR
jgi:hypothetical protein